jgi:HK97 gp10 family phage protein
LVWLGDELLAAIRSETPAGLFEGAKMLVEEAARRAPKGATKGLSRSGYAANEFKSTYKPGKLHNKEIHPKPGTAVAAFAQFYAAFFEAGTSKMAARPFVRPALDELKAKIGNAVVIKMAVRFK